VEDIVSKRRSNVTVGEKKMVLSVKKYFSDFRDGEVNIIKSQVMKNTSLCCGISEKTVRKICNEVDNNSHAKPPAPRVSSGRPPIALDDFFHGALRRKVHSFYLRKEFPCVMDIHREMKHDHEDFPEMSDSTLRRILKKIGFSFGKFNSKSVCFESPRITEQRQRFLKLTCKLRKSGYKIYYTDETWAGANHTKKHGWQENVVVNDSVGPDFDKSKIQEVNGWKGGLIVPSGAGKRLIIRHI
jgi:hypothetical protein